MSEISDEEKKPVRVQISYNSGFWHAHTISRGFLTALEQYLRLKPYLDVVVLLVDEGMRQLLPESRPKGLRRIRTGRKR